jgi:hypothetical protein
MPLACGQGKDDHQHPHRRVAEGKIVEHWGNSDEMGIMRQSRVIPG